MRGGSGPQGLALDRNNKTAMLTGLSRGRLAAVRSRLRSGEISERKQVGDAESMINEEPNVVQPGGASQWLE